MELAEIKVNDLGGAPVAIHNCPCAVCGKEKAVLILNTGVFEPCWECQKQGWKIVKLSRFWKWILKKFGVLGVFD